MSLYCNIAILCVKVSRVHWAFNEDKIIFTVPDAPPQAGQMYGGDDDQTSSSESEVELETVKNADARELDNPFRGKVSSLTL
jgi:hypothetical protein